MEKKSGEDIPILGVIFSVRTVKSISERCEKMTIILETDLEQFVVIAAFRYTLGRRSYAVSIITQWLIKNWDNIHINDQNLIRSEIQDALDHDCAGMEMDKQEWERVLRRGER